ncbi:MAG TPA: winged helix-turn-helix domain-containing protein [Edaphobacter sp.]|nr:winged helix-turn-helix domain-containing protein [Edaphobacter sp.]
MKAKADERPRPAKRRPKRIEEVVQYALGHKLRVEILILLNQGIFTSNQLAEQVGAQLSKVQNHLRQMLEDGSIEIAREERETNFVRHFYKAVEIPVYSKEAAEAMTPVQQQMTVGAILQSGMAEVLAGLYRGKLRDPRSCLYWDWYHVDQQGREDLETENFRYLARVREIEAEATNRRAETGEDSTSMLLNLAVFERARKAPDPQ